MFGRKTESQGVKKADVVKEGEPDMGDKGKKDKGKREVQKKAQLTLIEKRKKKKEKKLSK